MTIVPMCRSLATATQKSSDGSDPRQPVCWSDWGSDFYLRNQLHPLCDRDTRPGLRESVRHENGARPERVKASPKSVDVSGWSPECYASRRRYAKGWGPKAFGRWQTDRRQKTLDGCRVFCILPQPRGSAPRDFAQQRLHITTPLVEPCPDLSEPLLFNVFRGKTANQFNQFPPSQVEPP
jgi:hypothetical protein